MQKLSDFRSHIVTFMVFLLYGAVKKLMRCKNIRWTSTDKHWIRCRWRGNIWFRFHCV